MIQPEELVGDEWAEWYRLTPVQRWLESGKLWQTHRADAANLARSRPPNSLPATLFKNQIQMRHRETA